MDRFKALQTFVRIADHGSLTKAAQAMDLSLPAVVRSLAALEAHLRVRLFNRTTRRVALTDEGRRYLDYARQVLATLAEAERAISTDLSSPAGLLRVTAPVLFGQLHVAPAVTRFVQKHPLVQVELELLDRVVNLIDENFDAGIRIGVLDDSSLVARAVGSVRRVVVASPAFLRRHGTPKQPQDLEGLDCLNWSSGSSTWSFHHDGKLLAVPVRGSLRCNHVQSVIDACVAGLGCGMFMSYQVAALVEQRRLRIVLEAFEPPPRPVNLVVPQARLLPARTRVFIDWMLHELRDFKGRA